MAQPSQINALRSTDFPNGVSDKGTADKLFQILNPFLQQVGQTTTAGTSLNQNIDGQFAQVDLGKASGWQDMALTAPFSQNAFGGWPQPGFKVDGGRCYLRGLFVASSAPTAGGKFWAYPGTLAPKIKPMDATPAAGRLYSLPVYISGSQAIMHRFDAYSDALYWQAPSFAMGGYDPWANLTISTYNVLVQPQYRKRADGVVDIQGSFSSNAGAGGASFATLPAGYRPARTCYFPVTIHTTAPAWISGEVQIATNGVMTLSCVGGLTMQSVGLDHISFDTGTLAAENPGNIAYATLDGISWDCTGGNTFVTRPGFPLKVRLKDGKKPVAVLCWPVNKNTNQVEACSEPAWTPLGDSASGNQLQIDAVMGLQDNAAYTLNFFIFF